MQSLIFVCFAWVRVCVVCVVLCVPCALRALRVLCVGHKMLENFLAVKNLREMRRKFKKVDADGSKALSLDEVQVRWEAAQQPVCT